jgi:hypothetical protein
MARQVLYLTISLNIDENLPPSAGGLLELVNRKRVQELVEQKQRECTRHLAQTAVPVHSRTKLGQTFSSASMLDKEDVKSVLRKKPSQES